MTLTQDDLQAIKGVFDTSIERLELQTAAGFNEVHEKIADLDDKVTVLQSEISDVKLTVGTLQSAQGRFEVELSGVKQTVERIERVQAAETERLDRQETTFNKVRKAFGPV